MMQIGELGEAIGLPTQTIRYYERMGLLPKPQRASNGYRGYAEPDVRRLRFIHSARVLEFSLDDIKEILDLRDRGKAPCRVVMALMDQQITAIDRRIKELRQLKAELTRLHQQGRQMPEDVLMKKCVCHLIETGHARPPTPRALGKPHKPTGAIRRMGRRPIR
jgi:DNA-binding transcriptional MerR regulator